MDKPTAGHAPGNKQRKLRSAEWFNDPHNPGMTALYLERYLNYGLTRAELQSGKPIIGIAQTGSDISPCNRAHVELVKRVRDGIYENGGIPIVLEQIRYETLLNYGATEADARAAANWDEAH